MRSSHHLSNTKLALRTLVYIVLALVTCSLLFAKNDPAKKDRVTSSQRPATEERSAKAQATPKDIVQSSNAPKPVSEEAQPKETSAVSNPSLNGSFDSSQPVVVRSQLVQHPDGKTEEILTSDKTQLGKSVTVCVSGLRRWIKNGGHPGNLRLFLGGRILSDIEPSLINESQEYLNFMLQPNRSVESDRAVWADIFNQVRRARDHQVPLSVGEKDKKQPFDSEEYIAFLIYPWYTPFVALFLIVLLLALCYLGGKYGLLRDGKETGNSLNAPYSLGRFQMAWWFYLVIAAFLYVWLLTGEANSPTPSALALIGISATTGLAAVFVDQSKQADSIVDKNLLDTERLALVQRTKDLKSLPNLDAALTKELYEREQRLTEVDAKLAKLPAPQAPAVTQGLWKDLLRDGSGMSFHRFQIVIWTVILGTVFVRAVYQDLAMPDFNASLLGLMGLSAGTYIGFKIPEKSK